MLEIFRSCPRCGAHAKAEDERCASCGQPLGQAMGVQLHRKRKIIKWSLIGVLVVVALTGMIKPEWFLSLVTGRPPEAFLPKHVDVRARWAYDGAEPKARAWAWKLDKSLEDGCNLSYIQFTDKKKLEPTLNFQLLGGTVEAAKAAYLEAQKNKAPIPKLAPEEVQDALSSIGKPDAFIGVCLTKAYALIEPCEPFKDKLTSAEANKCLVPPVQKMLGGVGYRSCATNAQLPRVKTLCQVAAERMEAALQPPPAATGM